MTHPLDTYFQMNPKLSKAEFCERANISEMTLWRLRKGRGDCSTKLFRKVAEATNGEVSEVQLVAAFESARRRAVQGAA